MLSLSPTISNISLHKVFLDLALEKLTKHVLWLHLCIPSCIPNAGWEKILCFLFNEKKERKKKARPLRAGTVSYSWLNPHLLEQGLVPPRSTHSSWINMTGITLRGWNRSISMTSTPLDPPGGPLNWHLYWNHLKLASKSLSKWFIYFQHFSDTAAFSVFYYFLGDLLHQLQPRIN